MKSQLITSGNCSAIDNMEMDRILLDSLKGDPRAILHLYDWKKPTFTYGHFIKPEEFLHLDICLDLGFDWAKRPTGGGILFHLWDFTFSILIPSVHPAFSLNTLDNYRFINSLVEKALNIYLKDKNEFSLLVNSAPASCRVSAKFCMAHPTEYDILLIDKKVGGAAQRRTQHGLLHQGTISLFEPDFSLLEKIVRESSVVENMRLQGGVLFSPEINAKNNLKQAFENILSDIFMTII